MQITWDSEQSAERERFRLLAAERVAPHSAERDRAGTFADDAWKALAAEGIWTPHMAERYGGRGGSLWDFLAVFEGLALGAGDCGFVLSAVAHAGLMHVLAEHGTERQKARLLPILMSGGVGATAATEPHGGSHVAGVRTTAVADGPGGWRLSGEKRHITNAPIADVMLVVGRLAGLGKRDITLFVLDRAKDGLSTGPHEDLLGQRTSPTGAIHLDRVPVTEEDIVGQPGEGLAALYSFLAFDRLLYGLVVAGHLSSLLPEAVERARTRESFGQAIANHEYVQDKLVTMRATIEASRHLSYAAADALIRGADDAEALASCAKLAASEGAVASTLELVQLFGHAGYDRETGIERHLRDAVAIRLAGGTTEMQKKNIFKDVMLRYGIVGGRHDR